MLAMLASGCVTLERSYPEKRYYVLEARAPAPAGGAVHDEILQVSTLRISPRYQDRSFVYRISDSGFEAIFTINLLPRRRALISEEIRKSLIGAAAFQVCHQRVE